MKNHRFHIGYIILASAMILPVIIIGIFFIVNQKTEPEDIFSFSPKLIASEEETTEQTSAVRSGAENTHPTSPVKEEEDQSKYWPDPKELWERFQDEAEHMPDEGIQISSVKVFLKEQLVVGYTKTKSGEELPVRMFPCSSGYEEGHTPVGEHKIGMTFRDPWLFDNSQAQYGCQIRGNILFHSLPSYNGTLNEGLSLDDLNAMGKAASHGCVRLFCIDAKWIYDHCPPGTPVEVYERREGKYLNLPDQINYFRLKKGAPSWDPTDPDPNNPYHDLKVFLKWIVKEPWNFKEKVKPPVWPSFSPETETELSETTATTEFKSYFFDGTIPTIPANSVDTRVTEPTTAPYSYEEITNP